MGTDIELYLDIPCKNCGHEGMFHTINKHAQHGRGECVPFLINEKNPPCPDRCKEYQPAVLPA
jgi:hypothetical protein